MIFRSLLYVALFILLIATAACTEKKIQSFIPADRSRFNFKESYIEGDSVRIDKYLRNFKTEQLGERKFVLQPNDTIEFDEPMLKLFVGEIDGRRVQFWLSFGKSSYFEPICWYMQGDRDIEYSGLKEEENGYTFQLTQGTKRMTVFLDSASEQARVIYQGKTYIINQSPLRFKAYHQYRYFNTICEEYNSLFSHQTYNYNYVLDEGESDSESLMYIDLYNLLKNKDDTIIENRYDVISEPLNYNVSDSNGICLRWGFVEYYKPLYIDSSLFVTLQFLEEDTGGAHGWYAINHLNFDLDTHEVIYYEDVIDTNHPNYFSYLAQAIDNQSDGIEYDTGIDQIEGLSSFYILPSGIRIFYPNYWLGGGFWHKEFFLPYEEIKPFLKTHKYFRQ